MLKTPVNTNTKSLKFENGWYTVQKSSELNSTKSICDHCCKKDSCSIPSKMNDNKTYRFKLEGCGEFEPPILFRDKTGTDNKRFNTIRLGLAWGRRLYEGKVVGLVDKGGSVFGRAIVVSVNMGEKLEMLKKFSAGNHLLIGENIDKDLAFEKMQKILPSNYGNLIYKNNSMITVIELTRV